MTKRIITTVIILICILIQLAIASEKELDMAKAKQNSLVEVIVTAKDTKDRLTVKEPVTLSKSNGSESLVTVEIDDSKTFQTITGFGGAFTEATAYTLSRMSPDKRAEAIKAYFDPKEGIGYTLCRTHINSCDFSLGNYAYNEVDGDTELKHFDISRDKRWLIPLIKDAMAVEGASFKLFSSPWSPPAWMKTNGQMNQGGKLKPEYREAWALYYAKYIKAYAKEGIDIWGLTVQNEPAATQRWDSCLWTAEEEGAFVRDHLGPTLEKQGLGDTKIIIWDHNKDIIFERVEPILSDPEAAKYVWGVGFHWYSGDEFDHLDKVHEAFPNTNLLFTEGCQEGGVHLNDWKIGERYGHDILGDLNSWTVGWVDWNMVLDERGGPNHVDNLCDAPIIADTVRNELIYENSYYYLGHFSKYIRPGAVRIASSVNKDNLEVTAFKNTDGKVAVVVINRTPEAVDFDLKVGDAVAKTSSPARSIMTLLY
ncbi:MAG: glucosylceramidase [Planctomycetes bacterium]|nr:glucosylceramidase [Planctomycetota bacterium]